MIILDFATQYILVLFNGSEVIFAFLKNYLYVFFIFRTYCLGWKPIIAEDCVRMREYEYRSEEQRKSSPTSGLYRTYTGGGYELRYLCTPEKETRTAKSYFVE